MQIKASDISKIVNGEIVGNINALVNEFSKIEEAKDGSFTFFHNDKYIHYLENLKATILLVSKKFNYSVPSNVTLIKVEDPYQSLSVLLSFFSNIIEEPRIENPSFIHEKAIIGKNVYIGAFTYIGENCKIGDNAKIYPNTTILKNSTIGEDTIIFSGVKIYNNCIISKKCIIHSGAVIGSDGFGFAPNKFGEFDKIPQIGNVIIEENVEIGANTVIDRATMGSTIVRKGTKLDNLIQIAHNVEIGTNTVIAAQTGISGSTKIGNNVMIGGQAGLAGHISISNKSKINAQSGVSKSILKEGESVTGSPAWDYNKMLRSQAIIKKLPELFDKILNIEKKINTHE